MISLVHDRHGCVGVMWEVVVVDEVEADDSRRTDVGDDEGDCRFAVRSLGRVVEVRKGALGLVHAVYLHVHVPVIEYQHIRLSIRTNTNITLRLKNKRQAMRKKKTI